MVSSSSRGEIHSEEVSLTMKMTSLVEEVVDLEALVVVDLAHSNNSLLLGEEWVEA